MFDDLYWRDMFGECRGTVRVAEVPFGLTERGDVFGARLLENLAELRSITMLRSVRTRRDTDARGRRFSNEAARTSRLSVRYTHQPNWAVQNVTGHFRLEASRVIALSPVGGAGVLSYARASTKMISPAARPTGCLFENISRSA